ncbi:MAG: XRE family transcriptional regulator [Acidobacteria bacterium]|nr:MAG: XRE family transcriptional regulator [Acidobacteria bacterium 13_2_20CM_58_27]PYT73400.1 MAG: XRE family transcriptional regulator [Acidobacteriota bacterium]PYT83720.1 MAG: XRE family transcriptional regulator [Acidobacteriota bacterium]
MAKPKDKTGAVPSSGNLFADLGLPNAEEKQTKVRLAVAINDIIRRQQLSQVAAARRLNVNQPKVSALLKYQLQGFSVERLMRFLTALDRDIEIVIHHKSRARKSGRIPVTAA